MPERIVCGSVPRATCEAIVAHMVRDSPGRASAPVVVVDLGGAKVTEMYGNATPILVAFPGAIGDWWMTPPTWVHTGDSFSWLIQEWRHGALPDEFLELMRRSGIEP